MVSIGKADTVNFNAHSLDAFDRTQTVTTVYRLRDGDLVPEENGWVETWTLERRREKAREILSGKYITLCAFENGRAIGEIMLDPTLNNKRMIVESLHVSKEHRRKGIGRMLFERAKEEAKRQHASALYISACCAKETVEFYRAMGCRVSEDLIAEMAEAEPWDIQMECPLAKERL